MHTSLIWVMFMRKNRILRLATEKLQKLVRDLQFISRSVRSPKHFTRNRKLGFMNTMLISLNLVSRPIFCEINNYFKNVLKVGHTVEQQSFSEARQKIKHEAFKECFELMVSIGLSDEQPELYKGFRLLAVDGSSMQLKKSAELERCFASSTPTEGQVYARISMAYDILNDLILSADLAPYATGERELASKELKHVFTLDVGRCLVLLDRGYWTPSLFKDILRQGHELLLRVPNTVTKEIAQGDSQVTLDDGTTLRCRRFTLPSGEIETLVTSLSESELSDDEMKELYFMRWGIETKYDGLKNILKLDSITSKTHLTVMQDFYALMTLANLAAFAGWAAQYEIDRKRKNKGNKYAYKPNRNVIISALKDDMIACVAANSPYTRAHYLNRIQKSLAQRPVPIRPERSYPRPPKSSKRKKPSPRSVL